LVLQDEWIHENRNATEGVPYRRDAGDGME